MASSPVSPSPVSAGRYRYSKLRWRILVRRAGRGRNCGDGGLRSLRKARPITAPRRILIVQLDHLGDSVLTSPLLARLRTAYPAAAIDVLASPSNHEVFEADPA